MTLLQASLAVTTIVIGVADYTPLIFVDVIAGSPPQPIAGAGILLFFVHFFSMATLAALELYKGIRHAGRKVRQQYKHIVIGLLPVAVLAPLTGFVLPLLYQQTQFIILTPLYTFVFLSFVGYAMIRHGLFDIKRAAIRSVAYIGVLGSLLLIYYFLAYGLSFVLAENTAGSVNSGNPVSVMVALFLGILFQPIKQFFDRLTNNIFYKDIYDSDDFYNRLSSVLTSTTDLQALLLHASAEIAATLKAESAFFSVYRSPKQFLSVGTHGHARFSLDEVKLLDQHMEQGIISTNQLKESSDLYKVLHKQKIALVLPLTIDHKPTGYLALGEQRSGSYGDRDIKVLMTVSNELVIAIQNALSVQEVKELNATLQQRIDEATKELRASNAQLQKLDEAKDEFVSMASHQLRTPLTSVKGYISMVLEGDAGKISDAQRHLLSEAFTSSERMVHLINDFLNVSRLQTGKFMVDRRPIDLAKVTAQEVDSLKTTAKARDLKLSYRKPSHFPVLYIDEGKIRQVIMNFIDNAIYYSDEYSTITIGLEIVDGDAVVTIHNQGIGVPESEKVHLFTKFFRAENARRQRPDGTGVGLFLSKMVVTAHGGKMIFASEPNEGTTFGFRLPIKKLSTPPDEATT
ncbi:MAG TPA: ATP-binding protein [Candidatus Saccharimonadales bacterium]|nr:ATP-binding protein [Candidatus Saccharimonadales bacterium]